MQFKTRHKLCYIKEASRCFVVPFIYKSLPQATLTHSDRKEICGSLGLGDLLQRHTRKLFEVMEILDVFCLFPIYIFIFQKSRKTSFLFNSVYRVILVVILAVEILHHVWGGGNLGVYICKTHYTVLFNYCILLYINQATICMI